MLSTLSEKLYGSGNEGWLEMSDLILKMLKLFFCMTSYFSPRINSHYLTGGQDSFLENRYRVYADTNLLRHILSEFSGLTLPIFIHKRTV